MKLLMPAVAALVLVATLAGFYAGTTAHQRPPTAMTPPVATPAQQEKAVLAAYDQLETCDSTYSVFYTLTATMGRNAPMTSFQARFCESLSAFKIAIQIPVGSPFYNPAQQMTEMWPQMEHDMATINDMVIGKHPFSRDPDFWSAERARGDFFDAEFAQVGYELQAVTGLPLLPWF